MVAEEIKCLVIESVTVLNPGPNFMKGFRFNHRLSNWLNFNFKLLVSAVFWSTVSGDSTETGLSQKSLQ